MPAIYKKYHAFLRGNCVVYLQAYFPHVGPSVNIAQETNNTFVEIDAVILLSISQLPEGTRGYLTYPYPIFRG